MKKSYIITVAIALLLLAEGLDRASAQTLTTLHQFGSTPTDGTQPEAGLVQGSDGNFYGTTSEGGNTNLNYGMGDGTVFRISPSGSFTNLYQFSGSDGSAPVAALVQGSDGNFCGTTWYGGTNGVGTVFKITPAGNLTTLYQFGSQIGDGANPIAGLAQGSDGCFYGTTSQGGTNSLGTVFKITRAGSLTTLYQFNGFDGYYPEAGLVQGSDGNSTERPKQAGTVLARCLRSPRRAV